MRQVIKDISSRKWTEMYTLGFTSIKHYGITETLRKYILEQWLSTDGFYTVYKILFF